MLDYISASEKYVMQRVLCFGVMLDYISTLDKHALQRVSCNSVTLEYISALEKQAMQRVSCNGVTCASGTGRKTAKQSLCNAAQYNAILR